MQQINCTELKGRSHTKDTLGAVTNRNMNNSALLLLPAEIRNSIYEHVLYHGQIDICNKSNCEKPQPEQGDYVTNPHGHLPKNSNSILQVCKQMNSEAQSLVHSLNTFTGSPWDFLKIPKAHADTIIHARFIICSGERFDIKWLDGKSNAMGILMMHLTSLKSVVLTCEVDPQHMTQRYCQSPMSSRLFEVFFDVLQARLKNMAEDIKALDRGIEVKVEVSKGEVHDDRET